jgi:hypothetical protein
MNCQVTARLMLRTKLLRCVGPTRVDDSQAEVAGAGIAAARDVCRFGLNPIAPTLFPQQAFGKYVGGLSYDRANGCVDRVPSPFKANAESSVRRRSAFPIREHLAQGFLAQ